MVPAAKVRFRIPDAADQLDKLFVSEWLIFAGRRGGHICITDDGSMSYLRC